MSRAASIIEINGTKYNADSGDVVGTVKKVATQVKYQTKVIDGFVRKSGSYARAKTEMVRPKLPISERRVTSAKKVHSRTQRSHALMRNAVSRPRPEPAKTSALKPSVSHSIEKEQERRSRASAIIKHGSVKRFGATKIQPKAKEVTKAPTIIAKARPMGAKASAVSTPAVAPPSMVVSASHQRLERMLDEALLRADAHKKMMKKRSRNPLDRFNRLPRWLTIGLILLILVLVAGFFAWRDVPQVAVMVAGQEAHVSAGVPSYTPVGFATGQITHSAGVVSIAYKSTAGADYNYDITQRSSSWDSRSLAANVLTPNSQVQTSQVQGTTVYIYGAHDDATWVNNGVWYTLKNNASLSSDQILRIVQSL